MSSPSPSGRAAVLTGFGKDLEVQDFPVPPAPDGGMTVAVQYGGVCGTDLHLHQGHLDVLLPLVLGHEGLGVVHELGAGAGRDVQGELLTPGDRVMWASSIACDRCVPCVTYREPTLCENRVTYGVNRPTTAPPALSGSWASYISLRPGTTVVRVPDGVDPVAAMSLACAGPTMVHALFERRPVRVGETVVVQGSGPVGLAAAALAQLAGAKKVIVVGGPAARLRAAIAAGIGDEHVDIIGDPDSAPGRPDPKQVLAEVLERTGGRGADLVIECTGSPAAIGQGLALARRGGSYLVVGQYTDAGDTTINPHLIVYRQLDVIGSWAFTGAHLLQYVSLLPALISRFDLAPLVTSYPLPDWQNAFQDLCSGSVMKAVLTG